MSTASKLLYIFGLQGVDREKYSKRGYINSSGSPSRGNVVGGFSKSNSARGKAPYSSSNSSVLRTKSRPQSRVTSRVQASMGHTAVKRKKEKNEFGYTNARPFWSPHLELSMLEMRNGKFSLAEAGLRSATLIGVSSRKAEASIRSMFHLILTVLILFLGTNTIVLLESRKLYLLYAIVAPLILAWRVYKSKSLTTTLYDLSFVNEDGEETTATFKEDKGSMALFLTYLTRMSLILTRDSGKGDLVLRVESRSKRNQ